MQNINYSKVKTSKKKLSYKELTDYTKEKLVRKQRNMVRSGKRNFIENIDF